ncbi:sulfate transporter family-domain-containing protein [Pseudoneurospora amorphoporcata]|uniref:Sulfate transporter family-domain-containing protein n=1 Tax=Pseudoneurospora amorphoporcata TaxID=241081 RepID=A0AAN6SJF1_9PEZI|nr:sulfate transporter family-domain-containing protein [Pseudoneurospora amorphoporcata]
MASTTTTAGDRIKKFLGIPSDEKLDDTEYYNDGSFVESEPTTQDFLNEIRPTVQGTVNYVRELFPFINWIFHYNLTWLLGDFIAGVTVGFVVVPQGMAYAKLANLEPEFGLYTSFVGFLLYWAFATSKDITIGAVAVMSTIVGNIITDVQKEHPDFVAGDIARTLAFICGVVLLFLGLIRFGFIVEFIPIVAISAFMTGSAISIASGQVSTLMGIPNINSREETYKVIINTLKGLPNTRLDAAMGLTALFGLYFIRWFCTKMGKRYPRQQRTWFFVSTLRMVFIIILYILVSWLVNRHIKDSKKAHFKILGHVPSGFQHKGVPRLDNEMLSAISSHIPATILVLLIEHIAISKSFGRVNNYIINPSQELVAIGFTNLLGPFLGGYPATGSFSRTAIKAKAGVRTPLAGIFTAVLVLLALYALTSVFFYIPNSALAAMIIHAVGDLITPPREVYKFWLTSPLEVIIFFAGVFVSIFTSIENGIYVTVAASGAILLWRIAKSPGKFLGQAEIYTAPRELARGGGKDAGLTQSLLQRPEHHTAFLSLDRDDLSNPELQISTPWPGVFVYRFGEGLNYVNSAKHLDNLTIHVFKHTRRTELNKFEKLGDRPWNDPGPRRGQAFLTDELVARPTLRAIILDFSAVNCIDVTAAQALQDLRDQFDRYAHPDKVEWHFAGVSNRWTKRALVASGFGVDSSRTPRLQSENYKGDVQEVDQGPLIAIGPAGGSATDIEVVAVGTSGASSTDEKRPEGPSGGDAEKGNGHWEDNSTVPTASSAGAGGLARSAAAKKLVPVFGINRPFFHVDVATALKSAVRNTGVVVADE